MCLAIENDRPFAGLKTDKLIEFMHFFADFLPWFQVHENKLSMLSRKQHSAIIDILLRCIFDIDDVSAHK